MEYVSINTDGDSVFLIDKTCSDQNNCFISAYCLKTNFCIVDLEIPTDNMKNAVTQNGIYVVSRKFNHTRVNVTVIHSFEPLIDILIKFGNRFIKVSVSQQGLSKELIELSKKEKGEEKYPEKHVKEIGNF